MELSNKGNIKLTKPCRILFNFSLPEVAAYLSIISFMTKN
ncbi:hypothetical protein DB41_AI00090 [Neochlamydia sp. TUME1]|nr:hypothetical protein DB41_AI00090 [Neochlamydia sp. TUME1]